MANTIPSDLKPRIVDGALDVLEENMALLGNVEHNFDNAAGEKGDTVSIGKSAALTAESVTASNVAPNPSDVTLASSTITIDTFEKASFRITGQEFQNHQLQPTFIKQVQQAVRAVTKSANEDLFDLYYKIPYYAGDASRSIFYNGSAASIDPLADVGKVLRNNNVNDDMWKLFISSTEEAAAKKVATLQQANTFGTRDVVMNGEIGRVLGFDTFVDQQVPTHTTGSLTGDPDATAAVAVGQTSVGLTCDADDAVALKAGDLITFSGSTTKVYSVQADVTIASSATGSVTLDRGLETAVAEDETIALASGHGTGEINIAGDMTGFGMVSRLPSTAFFGGSILGDQMIVTHSSGFSLLMGVYSQYHQLSFEVAALWGVDVIQPEKLARALGA